MVGTGREGQAKRREAARPVPDLCLSALAVKPYVTWNYATDEGCVAAGNFAAPDPLMLARHCYCGPATA